MDEKRRILKEVFGYDQFRGGQERMIDAILQGRDALGVMPTGAGKSICYQLPALMTPGIALVVSPLISLMRDQVQALRQAGVAGAYLNSSLTQGQYLKALENAYHGKYKIIYVAPERLLTDRFLEFARSSRISLVAVDEAHCVSQWGQDFRPSYLDIPAFVSGLPRRPVLAAFTATATPKVRQDIRQLLELQSPEETCTGFDRENLFYQVRRPSSKKAALLECLSQFKGQSGVVYCATRKAVEEVCDFLQQSGVSAARYHAGLEPQERSRSQEDFIFDRVQVIVATNAFGMGIDKSNVRFVVHYNMPKDMESYYQEAGRAGRDGAPAQCVLLYSGQDVMTNQFLIEKSREVEGLDPETAQRMIQRDKERLRQMAYYCQTADCLRQYILRYFGQQAPDRCGRCGNCQDELEQIDFTSQARRIAACVRETGQRFGAGVLGEILRGAETEKTLNWNLSRYDCFGGLADMSQREILDAVQTMVQRGYLAVKEGKFPIVQLGPQAEALLSGQERVEIKIRRQDQQSRKTGRAARQAEAAPNPALFERLRSLRSQLARQQGAPAYVIFNDATLRQMSGKAPDGWAAMLEISGVGQQKMERYGQQFLDEIARWKQEQGR